MNTDVLSDDECKELVSDLVMNESTRATGVPSDASAAICAYLRRKEEQELEIKRLDIRPKPRPEDIDYFGGCPKCWRNDGYLNVDRVHWFICHKHRAKWFVGENLFSTCRDETEAVWQSNHDRIRGYRLVDPVEPPRVTA